MGTYYLLIRNQSGRKSIRKQRGSSYSDASKRYYHSAYHERTEGTVLRVSKKKKYLTSYRRGSRGKRKGR